jgi:K+-sensing histidine kinase KdpD
LIEQALVQILSNAGKFSPPLSIIRVNASTEDQRLVITVTDKGAGLTVEEKTRITEDSSAAGDTSGRLRDQD